MADIDNDAARIGDVKAGFAAAKADTATRATKVELSEAVGSLAIRDGSNVEADAFREAIGAQRRIYLTPQEFGAVGDGEADDTVALRAAITASGDMRMPLNGDNKLYRITGELRLWSNVSIGDMRVDASGLGVAQVPFRIQGAFGASYNLASDVEPGAVTIALTAAPDMAPDEWVYLWSQDRVTATAGIKAGEWLQVKSIAGSNVTFHTAIVDNYTVAGAAGLKKVDAVENVSLDNVHAFGSGVGGEQTGVLIARCRDVRIKRCGFRDFEKQGVSIESSRAVWVQENTISDVKMSGYGYGVVVMTGTEFVWITKNTISNARHGVAAGGTQGINRYVWVEDNGLTGCEGGIDSHEGSDFYYVRRNTLVGDGQNRAIDAISVECRTAEIIDNTVINPSRYGIVQNVSSLDPAHINVTGNRVRKDGGTGPGIWLSCAAGRNAEPNTSGRVQQVRELICARNKVDGFAEAIRIEAAAGHVYNLDVTQNIIGAERSPTAYGILLRTTDSFEIKRGAIGENHIIMGGAGDGIYLDADVADAIDEIVVGPNFHTGAPIPVRIGGFCGPNIRRLSPILSEEFYLRCVVPGTVAPGYYDFQGFKYLYNRRIQLQRVTHKLGAGTASIRAAANGAGAGSTVSVTTTLANGNLSSRPEFAATTTPTPFQVQVTAATGATDLEVEYVCRWVGGS